MLKQAGYGGERVVLMHPTDQTFYDAMSSVVAHSLRHVGINLDEQSLDWGTVVQRRTSKEPLGQRRLVAVPATARRRPNIAIRCSPPTCAATARMPGSAGPADEKMEALRTAWMDSNDDVERKRLDAQIQARAFETVPFVPLGQYLPPSAYRSNLDGILKGAVPGVLERQQVLNDRAAAPPEAVIGPELPYVASTERCGSFSIWPNVGGCPLWHVHARAVTVHPGADPNFLTRPVTPAREGADLPQWCGVVALHPRCVSTLLMRAEIHSCGLFCSRVAICLRVAAARPDGSAQWELRAGSPLRPSQQAHDVHAAKEGTP